MSAAIAPVASKTQVASPVPARRNGRKPDKPVEIPAELVRETIDGAPFYYRGFRDVLNKTKTI